MRTIVASLVLALAAGGCGSGGEDDGAPATTATAASCAPADFLPLLQAEFDDTAEELRIVEARVERCRGGYAQVLAVPDPSVCVPGVEHCYETEQVFFRFDDGAWRVLTYGTGLSCEDLDLGDDLRAACEALGDRG